MILYKKLLEIDKSKSKKKKLIQRSPQVFNFKKRNKEIYVQNEIKTLAQENLFMLKRLLEKTPNIDNRKLKEDYEKNQEYKNILCNYPSINFFNTNKNGPIIKSFNAAAGKTKSSNTSRLPTLYKISSLNFTKGRINKLDEQYYKHATKAIKSNGIQKEEKLKSEKDVHSGSGSGSGSGSEDVSGNGDKESSKK